MNEKTPSAQEKREAHIYYNAAFIGGFLGLFPVVSIAQTLGSAQTANLIEIVVDLLGKDGKMALAHVAGAFLYSLAIVIATVLPKHTKVNIKCASLTIDALAAVVMWRLPEGLLPIVYLYPTFFALPLHWCSFQGGYGFKSAAIFSTNNLRQFISSLAEIWLNGDKSFVFKAKFFGITLFCFHWGIATSWLCWHFLSSVGFLIVFAPIALCLALIKAPF